LHGNWEVISKLSWKEQLSVLLERSLACKQIALSELEELPLLEVLTDCLICEDFHL